MTTHLPTHRPSFARPALPAASRARRERTHDATPPAPDAEPSAPELPGVVEHDTRSLGAVVAAGLVLLGLVVGVALVASQLLDVVAWSMHG
ncbi:hypothetical protein [Cellulomonas massiliensis]|uniref:hypothetical protein n=1 Tax=Cellulomonas massiliensis TaxID=1465811 RepID=UPI00030B5B39|nr:hypothetical protein [Cellulomonas massiliensis]